MEVLELKINQNFRQLFHLKTMEFHKKWIWPGNGTTTDHMGLDERKPVFGGLRTTEEQTSLRYLADWSAHLLFMFWKVSYLKYLVSMIRKYHYHKPQTNPWHRKEEPLNHHEIPGRQTKQSNQLSLPHQDDYKTRMNIK